MVRVCTTTHAQVAAATKLCDMLAAQLEDRQTALTKARPDAGGDPEE